MIRPDDTGGFRFKGKLYRDVSRVLSTIAEQDEETGDCLARAFLRIEKGEVSLLPFHGAPSPGWYFVGECGFWIHVSVEPEGEWAEIVLLGRIS